MQIRKLRRSKGLTQKQLADEIGVTRTTVAMWESGSSYPRTDLLPKIAALLGCTIDDLFV